MITQRLKPLYDVKLIADGKQHFYQVGTDEKWLPGVTTALGMINKPALISWAAKSVSENIQEELLNIENTLNLTPETIIQICQEGKNIYKKKASEAADIGSRVHKAIDCLIRGEKPEITTDIEAGVQGFINWRDENKLEILAGDTRVASKLHGYGGSLDFVAIDKEGKIIIFDNKTTKKRRDADHGIYAEAAYQLSSYAFAFQETFGLEVKSVYGLWLNKEQPEFKAVKIANLNEAFQGFLAALKLYNLSKYEMFEL